MQLSERDFRILEAVIRAHIRTGEPVASFVVAQLLHEDVSSATIRNAFTRLTEDGFLLQPHTSAGRIPTKEAYATYTEALGNTYEAHMQTLKHALRVAERLQHELHLLTGIYDGHIQHLRGFSSLLHDSEMFDDSSARAIGDLLDAVIESPDELLTIPKGANVRILVRGGDVSGATLLVARAGPDRSLFAAGPMRMNYERALNLMTHEE